MIEPTEDAKRILISCGESFIGLLMPIRSEDGSTIANELEEWRAGWMHRLPDITHAGGGRAQDKPSGLESVTITSGGDVHDITDAVFNRVKEIVEPHL